jgi:anaphase-promoting complex subunit 1
MLRPLLTIPVSLFTDTPLPLRGFETPPSILDWVQQTITHKTNTNSFPVIEDIISSQVPEGLGQSVKDFTPRIKALLRYLPNVRDAKQNSNQLVESMVASGIDIFMVGTLPESLLAIIKTPVVQCQSEPPTTWNSTLLSYISREDLNLRTSNASAVAKFLPKHIGPETLRDVHHIAQATENIELAVSNPNSDRMAVSRLIFDKDRRFTEAVHMIEPYRTAIAECIPSPGWTDVQTLEAQKEVHNWVMTRTIQSCTWACFHTLR